MPWDKDTYVPNAELEEKFDVNDPPNLNYQSNLGDFGVTNRYIITAKNTSHNDRTLNYYIQASLSSCIVITRDESGHMLAPYTLERDDPYALCKGVNEDKKVDCLASLLIPSGKTKTYMIDVILPTNCYGGMTNFLIADSQRRLSDPGMVGFPEYKDFANDRDEFFDGEEFMQWKSGVLKINKNGYWRIATMTSAARKIFDGNAQEFRFVKTPSGYAGRYAGWDGYGDYVPSKEEANKIYLFDPEFKYLSTVTLGGQITDMVYSGGKVYAQADKTYVSSDGATFTEYSGNYGIPTGTTTGAVGKKGKDYYILNKSSAAKIDFESETPKNIRSAGEIYYSIRSWKTSDTDRSVSNVVSLSADAVNWVDVTIPDNELYPENVRCINGKVYIYTKYNTYIYDDIMPQDNIKIKLNGEYLASDVAPKVINNRTMIPLRFIFEKINCKVDWEGKTQEITITNDSKTIKMNVGDTKYYVNGSMYMLDSPPVIDSDRTLVPLRFIAQSIGYSVQWDHETQTATVNKK